jgi:hypothetical protein
MPEKSHIQKRIEYSDGPIILEPRELINPYELSKRTLKTMDESIKNLKGGKVSEPIDLSTFADN